MASRENVKISIIVPVYNTEDYLGECLDSVLSQDYTNYEIVCVNDGSTDGSLSILETYRKMDARIRVVTTENKGLSSARNTGVSLAMGEYICYLDSDDMLERGALSRLAKEVVEDKPDMVVYNARLLYENDEIRKKYNKDAYYGRQVDYGYIHTGADLFVRLIENNQYIETAWLMLLRKDYLQRERICFYEGILHEDTLYSVRCYINAKMVKFQSQVNYIYRIRENSIMTKAVTSHNIISRLVAYDEILKEMYSHDLQDGVARAIEKYLKTFVDELRTDIKKVEDMDSFRMGMQSFSPRLSHHIYAMGLEENVYEEKDRVLKLGFNKLIEEYKDIYIYGAGKVATKVYMYVDELGLSSKIKGFVTTTKENEKIYMDKPLVCLDDVGDVIVNSQSLVLVAVRRKYHQEIANVLKARNIYNYVLVNENLEDMIEKQR